MCEYWHEFIIESSDNPLSRYNKHQEYSVLNILFEYEL